MKKIIMLSVGLIVSSFMGLCHATTHMFNFMQYPVRVSFGRVGGAICPSVPWQNLKPYENKTYGGNSCIMDRLTVEYEQYPGTWTVIFNKTGKWSHPQYVFIYAFVDKTTGAVVPRADVR